MMPEPPLRVNAHFWTLPMRNGDPAPPSLSVRSRVGTSAKLTRSGLDLVEHRGNVYRWSLT